MAIDGPGVAVACGFRLAQRAVFSGRFENAGWAPVI
jgi:hypothetical protein